MSELILTYLPTLHCTNNIKPFRRAFWLSTFLNLIGFSSEPYSPIFKYFSKYTDKDRIRYFLLYLLSKASSKRYSILSAYFFSKHTSSSKLIKAKAITSAFPNIRLKNYLITLLKLCIFSSDSLLSP